MRKILIKSIIITHLLLALIKIAEANSYLQDAKLIKHNYNFQKLDLKGADSIKQNFQKTTENFSYQDQLLEIKQITNQTVQKIQQIEVQENQYLKNLKNIKPDYASIQDMMPHVDLQPLQNSNHKIKQPINQLLIFISASLPRQSLINYANSARKSGAVLVLRGLINNSMKQTAKFIHNLSKQGTYAIIDPISYRNFNITQVPTIVLISDDHQCQYGKCTFTPRHDRITGNITLNYTLREFKNNGEFKQEAKRYLSDLEGRRNKL